MDAAKLLSQLSLHDYKGRYYIEKFGTVGADPTTRTRIVKSFVEALQWVMLYYTWGVPSWGWFYPFHYAPMTSDLTSMSSFRIEFVKGAPFKPFQQLLGCLPAASAKFLPACYRDLMTSPDSPIASAFPDVNDIKVDMNGKRNPWEGVVLIPFIDEVVMLRAIADRCPDSDLTPDVRLLSCHCPLTCCDGVGSCRCRKPREIDLDTSGRPRSLRKTATHWSPHCLACFPQFLARRRAPWYFACYF
jgi:5'-3' exoribonuclease 1